MYISGAKFEKHWFNTYRDIVKNTEISLVNHARTVKVDGMVVHPGVWGDVRAFFKGFCVSNMFFLPCL